MPSARQQKSTPVMSKAMTQNITQAANLRKMKPESTFGRGRGGQYSSFLDQQPKPVENKPSAKKRTKTNPSKPSHTSNFASTYTSNQLNETQTTARATKPQTKSAGAKKNMT